MDRSDGHQSGQQKSEAKDKASEVPVVTGDPRTRCRDYQDQSELRCDPCVRGGHENVEHGGLQQISFAGLNRYCHPVLLRWKGA